MDDAAALWLLRHGQSEGNVIRAAASRDAEELDIPLRDMDVPLSAVGRQQAEAFGMWLKEDPSRRPDVVISSPYRRAMDTAEFVVRAAGSSTDVFPDERLRERDLGIMDLLTLKGFAARYPLEAAHRKRLGKFYYRPPGGESWVDVALRCRSIRDSIARELAGCKVLLVTHEVAIIMFRYLLERLGEREALALSQSSAIANCSLTAYSQKEDGRLSPDVVAWTAPLEETDVPITESPDDRIALR